MPHSSRPNNNITSIRTGSKLGAIDTGDANGHGPDPARFSNGLAARHVASQKMLATVKGSPLTTDLGSIAIAWVSYGHPVSTRPSKTSAFFVFSPEADCLKSAQTQP